MPATTGEPRESAAQPHDLTGFVPFPADRAAAYRAAGLWTGGKLDSVLRTAATAWPGQTAVVDAAGSDTYAALDERADRAAATLAARGIAQGDRVLLQLPNSRRFAVALFGLLRAGAIPVMCLPGHRMAELTHFAEVGGAAAMVVSDSVDGFDGFDHRAMALKLARTHPLQVIGASELDAEPPGAAAPSITIDPQSPALLLVSGGTTGLPKLIPRTHADYIYNLTASAELCRLTHDDVYLVSLPAAHNFPLACPGMLGAMSVGASVVFGTDPSPESAFATIVEHGVTVTALVPALARLWAQACQWESVVPTTLRLLQVGGAKLGADDTRHIRNTLTRGVQQVFGMAEGLLNYTRLDDPDHIVDNTQGRPMSEYDEVRVVDEHGADVPPGEDGELLVRGPYTLNGYFNAAAANERSFSPEGFYRSGDKVRRSENGYLEVTGRVKDVIHRGGETVSALDLEEHLMTHPAIWTAAAVPLPDEYLGERICAAVVFSGPAVTLAELNGYLDTRGVATHARPDVIAPMPTLPTTAVGKVDKQAIARALAGGAG